MSIIRTAKIAGRRRKGDFRCLHTWVDQLDLRANAEGQQFILAALYDILIHPSDPSPEEVRAWKAICKCAEKKRKTHRQMEKENGVAIRITERPASGGSQ